MADDLDCRGSLKTTIRTLFKEAIKSVQWHNVTCQVPRIFTSEDAYIHFFYFMFTFQ